MKFGLGINLAIGVSGPFVGSEVGPASERIRLLYETPSAAAPRPAISQAERDRRAYAVSFGTGSTRFEGGILTTEAEAINARFVAGELTQAEWIKAMLASDTVLLGE